MDWLSLFNASAAVCALWWIANKVWLRVFYDVHRLPSPKREWPILGHALNVPNKPRLQFTQWAMKETLQLGKIWRYNFMGVEHVIITDGDFLKKNIFGPGDKNEPKDFGQINFDAVFSEDGMHNLFSARMADEKYKEFRKSIAMAFRSENLRKKFPGILQHAKKCVDIVDGSVGLKAIDYQKLGIQYAFDTVGTFAYGMEFNSLWNGHPLLSALFSCVDESFMDLMNPFRPIARAVFPFSQSYKRHQSRFKALREEKQKLFERMDLLGDDPPQEDLSIRACLMRMRNPLRNNEKANMSELRSESNLFLVAGADSTGSQIGWTMMWIANSREVQDKIYSELKANGLIGPGARELGYEDLSKLSYIKMVVMESLRITPAVPIMSDRTTTRDITAMGYKLPKGIRITALIRAQNNAPWIWKDPQTFNPERWEKKTVGDLDERGPVGKLWSFSTGIRDCLGQRLALMEMQLIVAVLLSNFTFELDPRMGSVEAAWKMAYDAPVSMCLGGMWLKATRRSHTNVGTA